MKKFFCLLLVILMISSLTVCAFANEVITVVPIAPGYGYSHYKYHNYGHNFSERKFIPVVKEIKCIDTTPKKVIPIVPKQKNIVQEDGYTLIPIVSYVEPINTQIEKKLIPIVAEQPKKIEYKLMPIIPSTGVQTELQ